MRQVEFNCPECKNKLIADVDIDAIVKQRLLEIVEKVFKDAQNIHNMQKTEDNGKIT